MNQFNDNSNPNKNNGGYCYSPSDKKPQDMQMKTKPMASDSYGDDRTDDELIDEMESGEYDRSKVSDDYERL